MVLFLWLMRLATIENGTALEDGVALAELKAFLLRSSTFCFFFPCFAVV